MPTNIAIAYLSEGAGHATRLLAIAEHLDSRGLTVSLGGGGPGAKFVEMNGYTDFYPTDIDFVSSKTAGETIKGLLKNSPVFLRRFLDFKNWIDRKKPDAVLTDDPHAFFAALVTRTPVYRLEHMCSSFYDNITDKMMQRTLEICGSVFERKRIFTSIHDAKQAVPNALHAPPIAHDIDHNLNIEPFDVLLSPSTYSTHFDEIQKKIEETGHTTRMIGGPDWNPVKSVMPYFRAADVAITAGFTSTSEAAVAGTPCIMYPTMTEQKIIAKNIKHKKGFTYAQNKRELLERVCSPPERPEYENGAEEVAEYINKDLETF